MKNVQIEQLKNHLELKVGLLRIKNKNGEYDELLDLYEDYNSNGTTLEELKLFYDDVLLALE